MEFLLSFGFPVILGCCSPGLMVRASMCGPSEEGNSGRQGHVQELEKRYQNFRQYVQTAHDKGQHAPMKKLARSFTNEQQRRAKAESAPQRNVQGADADFDSLIAVAKRCVTKHFSSPRPPYAGAYHSTHTSPHLPVPMLFAPCPFCV
jgi:hypothetical protein